MSAKKTENNPAEPINPEAENPEVAKVEENNSTEPKEPTSQEIEAETNSTKLRVLIAFTDKFTDEPYKVNDVISVQEERAKELLADSRRLVEKLN